MQSPETADSSFNVDVNPTTTINMLPRVVAVGDFSNSTANAASRSDEAASIVRAMS